MDGGIERRMLLKAAMVVGGGTALGAGAVAAAASATGSNGPPPTVAPDGTMHLPARDVPLPRSVSAEARGFLLQASRAGGMADVPRPALDDAAGWRQHIARTNAGIQAFIGMADARATVPASLEQRTIGGVPVYVSTRTDRRPSRRVYLSFHGGAFIYGGGRLTGIAARMAARQLDGTVYAVDYRAGPGQPHPAALDDCMTVYRALLAEHDPRSILVGGGSAGGNLAGALAHRARDERLPMPAALFLWTPATDLTRQGDTLATNAWVDPIIRGGSAPEDLALYVGKADLRHPYLSPLFGDLSRFPPTYLRSGTRDMLLSDTVRMHAALRRAGVDADLYVGEAMPHGGFAGLAPEDAEADADLLRWLEPRWLA